jgi:hypothetical protein
MREQTERHEHDRQHEERKREEESCRETSPTSDRSTFASPAPGSPGRASSGSNNAAKAIDVAAYLAVQDCQKRGIPIKVIKPPYLSDPPGISDHRYCTDHLKDGNTHRRR